MESNIAGSGSWNRPRKDSFSLSSFRQSEAEQLDLRRRPLGLGRPGRRRGPAGRLEPAGHRGPGDLRRRPLAAGHLGRARSAAAPADPADRHRQRQHRRHPHPARPGRRPRDPGCGLLGQTQLRVRRRGQVGAASGPAGATATPRRPAARPRTTTATGSGCCTTTPARRPTRCYRAARPRARPTAPSTSPDRSCCCPDAGRPVSRSARSGSASPAPAAAIWQLDSGEIDQGQRDQPQARLGVSTCGMLVRTSVWNDLDGLDPAHPGLPRRRGVRLAGPPQRLPGGHHARAPWSPTARWVAPACARAG